MKNWKALIFLLCFILSPSTWARNHHPSSGRPLSSGHWLTCGSGGDSIPRQDPFFHKDSPEEEVAKYIPEFKGQFSYEVKDTWEEWVTHSGMSCSHCGQTCQTVGSGKDQRQSCSCNSCSWQELETLYRHWSTQNVSWHVKWNQSKNYRQKRKDWIASGKPVLSHNKGDIEKLLEFDPDRPLEYYLFPGEVESVNVNQSSGESVYASVSVGNPRHKYDFATNTSLGSTSFQCDDVDYSINSWVDTGKRIVSTTPNSIQFKNDWVIGQKSKGGDLLDEPTHFQVTDIAAQLYENQNVYDNYKNTKVGIRLKEVDRNWWWDAYISKQIEMTDANSVLKKDRAATDGRPRFAVFEFKAQDVMITPVFGSQFHLHPGKKFELCASVLRKNNIYYASKKFWFFDAWSEPNCAQFAFVPPSGYDLRSGGRKVHDFISKITPLPIW